ncbi:MAG: cell division protein ZapA [Pseudomonadota bacterium]
MAEVTIYINGRSYDIACDNGQEGRVVDLAAYIDQKLQQISRSGASYNDAHLVVLTTLVLADELFDLREQAGSSSPRASRAATAPAAADKEEDEAVLRVIDQLTKRIDGIATRVQAS